MRQKCREEEEQEEGREIVRRVRESLYRKALDKLRERADEAWRYKSARGAVAPHSYRLRGLETAREAFGGTDVPLELWETRWRAFHQVLNTGTAQPWLRGEAQACAFCRRWAPPQQSPVPRDTAAHFVSECPVAKRLWKELSRRLGWPALERQHPETILSGLGRRRAVWMRHSVHRRGHSSSSSANGRVGRRTHGAS